MRRLALTLFVLAVSSPAALAQGPAPAAPDAKKNANPCRDEVAAALRKLRNSSWFQTQATMMTEKGPTKMDVSYVLPDKMRQKITVQATGDVTEMVLVNGKAWAKIGSGDWQPVADDVTQQLRAQMQENVVEQQEDVGNYACKGRTNFQGQDVFAYKLEDEGSEDSSAPKNEAYRMFYVDAITGLPVSVALVAPGREDKPLFQQRYSYPLDVTIEPPKIGTDGKPAASDKAE